jgi:hypothetical protein
MGSMANSVMTERVNLTTFDSSSQTYRSTCTVGRTMPPMTDNTPAMYGKEGGVGNVDRYGYSQCCSTQISLPS